MYRCIWKEQGNIITLKSYDFYFLRRFATGEAPKMTIFFGESDTPLFSN